MGRLTARDDQQFTNAFLELYVHETAVRLGAAIEVHPAMSESTRNPDFRFAFDSRPILVEAKAIHKSRAARADEARLNSLLDRIDEADFGSFGLALTVVSQGPDVVASKRLVCAIGAWLAALDHDHLLAEYSRRSTVVLDDSWPELTFNEKEWFLRFRPWPLASEEDYGSIVLISLERSAAIDDVSPIQKRVREKSHVYGKIDKPYVIALDTGPVLGETFAMNAALFGRPAVQISTVTGETTDVRLPDGLLIRTDGPRNTQVSGFLVSKGIRPWNVETTIPELWLNPFADHPLTCRPAHVRIFEVDNDGRFVVTEPTVSLSEFFES